MSLILAIDQGTTATTAIAVDEDRTVVARATAPTPLAQPKPGWAENDPTRVLEACGQVVTNVVAELGGRAEDVEAIGITNQRETTVAWDANTGEPLGPAVSWQCRRTADICRSLREDEFNVELVRRHTGLVIDPYFSGTKMRWMLDNVPRVKDAEARGELLFGTIDSFVTHALTSEHATDPSNASRTMLYDIRKGDWDLDLTDMLDVPLETLADVRASTGPFGKVDAGSALGSQVPHLEGVPVCGIAGDQQASLFGHGCFAPGQAKGTLGTGAFFLVNTGGEMREPAEGILTTIAWDLGEGPVYALEGAAFACGSALEWASQAGLLDEPSQLDELGSAVDGSDGAVFVPALYGLAAPHWDPEVKGLLAGLTASTTRQHIARAIAEGLAAQNALLLKALAACGQGLDEVRLDGGVSRSSLLCQLIADATGVDMLRTHEGELTALGAAGLAGLSAGLWTAEDLVPERTETFQPEGDAGFVEAYEGAITRLLAR